MPIIIIIIMGSLMLQNDILRNSYRQKTNNILELLDII